MSSTPTRSPAAAAATQPTPDEHGLFEAYRSAYVRALFAEELLTVHRIGQLLECAPWATLGDQAANLARECQQAVAA